VERSTSAFFTAGMSLGAHVLSFHCMPYTVHGLHSDGQKRETIIDPVYKQREKGLVAVPLLHQHQTPPYVL
jgi:hypothetical protein